MQQFLRRRFHDEIFLVVLMALFAWFANLLHIDATRPSNAAHLILQAQAWLNGHLDLGMRIYDTIILHDKVFIIYPPLPSLMMLPLVAILGHNFSDIWFTWIFAALNIILLFRTLEVMRVRSITSRTPLENLIMALVFGFGTNALWLCLGGRVWFTIQTVSMFGIMLTLHSTLSRRWALATLGVGMVMLTRTSEALIGIVPLIVYLHDLGVGRRIQNKWHVLPERWPSIGELAITLAPFVVALIIYLVHNKLYYNNILSTGFDIQNQQDYPQIKNGVLSWTYIWHNFIVDFLRAPDFTFKSTFDVNPQTDLITDGVGTSMFYSTPLLAIFIFAPQGKTPQIWLRRTFWVAVAIILLSVLAFCATGWYQVSARYVFPIYPLLFLLLAQRAAPLNIRWISLAGLGIFVNILLAQTFWLSKPSSDFVAVSAVIVVIACLIAISLLRWQAKQHNEIAAPASIPAESTIEMDRSQSDSHERPYLNGRTADSDGDLKIGSFQNR